ncbi:putative BTB/POZ domain containing protein [Lyophyllum shimeji]|uniref:BTB/POZ domain containing protein n=1 Tax=Lyophyllum shimeji TaxID=47721 RepID=A0A9P3PTY8_LYOSH|nr:putative BTB/POZ domain containing protein [Lyophyllum shimeji]
MYPCQCVMHVMLSVLRGGNSGLIYEGFQVHLRAEFRLRYAEALIVCTSTPLPTVPSRKVVVALPSQLAGHPFDDPNADIILRSSDEVPTDFRVYKLLLSLASPFFATAFTLPQPDNDDGTPVMEMEEDKHTLELILGLCYPISVKEPPPLSSLKDLLIVTRAVLKFEMSGIQNYVKGVLVQPRFIEAQPLRVFAIACHFGWAKEAGEAARCTLRQAADIWVDELELISGATYHRLLRYRRKCAAAASRVVLALTRGPADESDWVWDEHTWCVAHRSSAHKGTCPGPREWWLSWMNEVEDLLRERPCGETVKKADLLRVSGLPTVALCDNCAESVARELEDYTHVLARLVDRAISGVKLLL